ncbi:MAG TPA: PQQ-binding-like beta-propeller repeat protein [Candidatus Bathyarchaeia archaeon]|nr:PQQ-binding-like beta-propeller repeat protein [Candidatus Bathyarchaeia archaeon]
MNYNWTNFCIKSFSEKEIKWHLNVGGPILSSPSPSLHNGILVAATYDSWIKNSSIWKNFVLGIDSNDGKQIWSYEIKGDIFSSPCLVSDGMMIIVGSMNKIIYGIQRESGCSKQVEKFGLLHHIMEMRSS